MLLRSLNCFRGMSGDFQDIFADAFREESDYSGDMQPQGIY